MRALFVAGVALLAVPLACDAGGIVGGTCRTGTSLCEGSCRDLAVDSEHCGECGNVCEPGLVCESGQCRDPNGGAGGGGGSSGGGTSEGGEAAEGGDTGRGGRGGRGGAGGRAGGGRAGGGGRSGGVNAGEAGATEAPCLPPYDTAEHCGDCDTACTDPAPLCAPDDAGSFECVPLCEPPLIACGDQCVDTNVHPLHCGGCFNVCPSGICQDATCVGATTGHVALYCMNYSYAREDAAHTVLLGNAVFLPFRSEVRILAFTRWAPVAGRNAVNRVIDWSAASRGRSYTIEYISDPALLSSRLSIQNFEVFLVYEQTTAPQGQLADLGSSWGGSLVLDSFARAGGMIVVLDGAQGTGEMDEFINTAGLFSVDGHSPIDVVDTTTRFYNRAPGDALGINVLSPVSAVPYSCTFQTLEPPTPETVFVLGDAPAPDPGNPVVVHRIVMP